MSFFSQAALEHLQREFASVQGKAQRLAERLLQRPYTTEAAREYAHHGVSRRVTTISHCIRRVFETLPPDFVGVPDREQREDATIFIQACVFHTFGVLDNLAAVWVHERRVTKANGNALSNARVGLSEEKQEVWASLTPELREYLAGLAEWSTYLEDFRHSLAHRIPLYVPPFALRQQDAELFDRLFAEGSAALRRHDFAEYKRLEAEREAMKVFQPLMQHSVYAETAPMVLHGQIIADFNTVEDVCHRFLEALGAD